MMCLYGGRSVFKSGSVSIPDWSIEVVVRVYLLVGLVCVLFFFFFKAPGPPEFLPFPPPRPFPDPREPGGGGGGGPPPPPSPPPHGRRGALRAQMRAPPPTRAGDSTPRPVALTSQ